MDQKGFQSSLDKLINGLLYFSPVGTLIFKHHAVNRKASVHLKIKDSFCLFKGQKAVFHQACNEILLAEIRQLFQHPGGSDIIKEQHLIMGCRTDFFTERISAV